MEKPLVFISAKSADYDYGAKLARYLEESGVRVFFSPSSLGELGDSDYRRAIDAKLEECAHMIVVTSSLENVTAPWVEAEWGFFINAKRGGEKKGNLVTVTVGDLSFRSLPPSLRYYEAVVFDEKNFAHIARFVRSPDREKTLRRGEEAQFTFLPEALDGSFRISVTGVGGAGQNIVSLLTRETTDRIQTIALNTDRLSLERCQARQKLLLGLELTRGRGAEGDPETGREAALESLEEIRPLLQGHLLMVCAGLGGGTGTGAAPVVARAGREMGMLVLGFATTPFPFEGKKRKAAAERGLAPFLEACDALILVPNEKLVALGDPGRSIASILEDCDTCIVQCIKSWTDTIHSQGLVNIDFADLRSVASGGGIAYMGLGRARGGDRARAAATKAVTTGYLGDNPLTAAKSVFFSISSADFPGMDELTDATDIIEKALGDETQCIWGCHFDESLGDQLQVTLVATSFEGMGPAAKEKTAKTPTEEESRVRAAEKAPGLKSVPEELDSDFEVPTFMRKMKD